MMFLFFIPVLFFLIVLIESKEDYFLSFIPGPQLCFFFIVLLYLPVLIFCFLIYLFD